MSPRRKLREITNPEIYLILMDPKIHQRLLASARRKETFSTAHGWRRNENPAARYNPTAYLKGTNVGHTKGHSGLETILSQNGGDAKDRGPKDRYVLTQTNDILEYFGFNDGEERTKLLKSFDEDFQHGADLVKRAYRLAMEYGLRGDYYDTPIKTKDTFIAIARYIFSTDFKTTKLVLRDFGINRIQEAVGNDYRGVSPI